jgi:hypothetical protein
VDATAHTAEVLEWAEVRIGSALQAQARFLDCDPGRKAVDQRGRLVGEDSAASR